jgi:hypothetical protein
MDAAKIDRTFVSKALSTSPLGRCPAIEDGDRFWGQVRELSGSFRELRRTGR